jgi:hypothetical protein
MTDKQDPLEAELSALRLHPISTDLRRRIGERLAEPVVSERRWLWSAALVGSPVAVCVIALVWVWLGGNRAESPPEFAEARSASAASVVYSEPTLLAYQRALTRSSEEFDRLLNRNAFATPLRDPEPVLVGAFTRSDSAFNALLGDD